MRVKKIFWKNSKTFFFQNFHFFNFFIPKTSYVSTRYNIYNSGGPKYFAPPLLHKLWMPFRRLQGVWGVGAPSPPPKLLGPPLISNPFWLISIRTLTFRLDFGIFHFSIFPLSIFFPLLESLFFYFVDVRYQHEIKIQYSLDYLVA